MKAFVIRGPREAGVEDVRPPAAAPGEVVVDVARAGVCGTDIEFFTGEMQYLHEGHAASPMRIGHEWTGTVSAVGEGVDRAWVGRRVTGDTMLGCGSCPRCRGGRQHVCADRTELGIRGGRHGALAEQVAIPARALAALPDEVDDAMGALVEPGANALRSVRAADLRPGDRVLILGAGTIGLLAALFAGAAGADPYVADRSPRALDFARSLGLANANAVEDLPDVPWDAVIDASTGPSVPALAVALVEPGKRVVFVGLAGSPSQVDTRTIALKDVTAVGILSGSGGLAGAIEAYAGGAVDPRPLVAATVDLGGLAPVLAGVRPSGSGAGPKFHAAL